MAIRLLSNQTVTVNEVLNQQIFEPNESYGKYYRCILHTLLNMDTVAYILNTVIAMRDDHNVYLKFDQFYDVALKYMSSPRSHSRRRSNTCNKSELNSFFLV